MQTQKQKRTLKASPFILKLAKILDTPEYQRLISWTPCGRAFIVHEPYQFSSTLLPKYFRHSNYGSFLRQLNFYSFTKVKTHKDSIHQFQHPLFVRGQTDKYKMIKREKINESEARELSNQQQQNEQLSEQKYQQQVLEEKIHSLKRSQTKLLRDCREMLEQGNQTIELGFIKSAEVENESTHNQIICNRIFDFIDHYPHLAERFTYLDTTIINNLLSHLDSAVYPPVIHKFFEMVGNSDLQEMIETLNSALLLDQKRGKNFTIVNQKQKQLPFSGFQGEQSNKQMPGSAALVVKKGS